MFHVKTPLSGSLLGHSIEVSHSRPGDCSAARVTRETMDQTLQTAKL